MFTLHLISVKEFNHEHELIQEDMMKDSWYLIQFKRNSHRLAELHLNQQGFKTFLPLQDITSKVRSKFLTRKKPLFPGYMFVRIELNNAPWQKIKSTRGVSRIFCQNGIPKLVPSEVIFSLMSRCDSLGNLLPPETLERGDPVVIVSGALANFVATVETIDINNRIWVLLDVMGQLTRVNVVSRQINRLN